MKTVSWEKIREETIQTTNDRLHALVAQVEERNRTMSLANEMTETVSALGPLEIHGNVNAEVA